jgi:hypothetical protein
MSRTVFLDAGPLGILTYPRKPQETVSALRWADIWTDIHP